MIPHRCRGESCPVCARAVDDIESDRVYGRAGDWQGGQDRFERDFWGRFGDEEPC